MKKFFSILSSVFLCSPLLCCHKPSSQVPSSQKAADKKVNQPSKTNTDQYQPSFVKQVDEALSPEEAFMLKKIFSPKL
jgi:hypothetical protein